MIRNQKMSGRAVSMPAGLLFGATTSLGITILGSVIIAKLLDAEIIEENAVGYAVLVMLMTASFAGATISRNKIKRQYLIVCGLSGVIYYITLMGITALFFGGQYEAVGVTCILVMGGSVLALVAGKKPDRVGKRRKTVAMNR